MPLRFFIAFLASFLTLISSVAGAATFLSYASQAGDWVGEGRTQTLAVPTFAITARHSFPFDEGAPYVRVEVDNLAFGFQPPTGQPFVGGSYDASVDSVPSAQRGNITVRKYGFGCGGWGKFTVRELVVEAFTVVKFAVDFELHCGFAEPAFSGGIRVNSDIPYVQQAPPPYPPATIHYRSEPGDTVGMGASGILQRGDAYYQLLANGNGGIDVVRRAPGGDYSYLVFNAPLDAPLRPGIYEGAQKWPSARGPKFEAYMFGNTCNQANGRFTVHELEFGIANKIEKFAVDFEYHCNGLEPALFGAVRYNSAIPYDPDPLPPAPNAVRSVKGSSPNGGGEISLTLFSTRPDCTFAQSRIGSSNVAAPPAPLMFPHGVIDFRVESCETGGAVTFVIQYPKILPPTAAYWKYGPTPENRTPHWYAMPGKIDGSRFIVTIVDGGLGDDDLTANGSIADVGGVAIAGGVLQDLWWSGAAENGWGMSIIQHRDVLVANVYIYDDLGRPTWLILSGGTWNAARTAFTGALYVPHGSPYYAYDVTRFNIGAPVGNATFTFLGDDTIAIFEYTINGVSGRKTLVRLAFGRPEVVAAPNAGDLWWGGINQNGWGITVLQQVRTLFSLWFTYDAAGAPTWYVMPGGEWTASDTYEGRIYRAVGSKWIGATYDASQHRTIDVGSYRLRFTGENATFEYTVDGRSGTEPLTRLGF